MLTQREVGTILRADRNLIFSSYQTRSFGIELPTGKEVLHRDRIVAGAKAHFLVEIVRFFELGEIDFDAEAATRRHR